MQVHDVRVIKTIYTRFLARALTRSNAVELAVLNLFSRSFYSTVPDHDTQDLTTLSIDAVLRLRSQNETRNLETEWVVSSGISQVGPPACRLCC